MEKINCNVIQDILPLYIDDVVSDDTKELVEEHLQNCEICQRVYHETKTDLENDMKISAQTKESSNEANDLKSFRKFLKKRKIKKAQRAEEKAAKKAADAARAAVQNTESTEKEEKHE